MYSFILFSHGVSYFWVTAALEYCETVCLIGFMATKDIDTQEYHCHFSMKKQKPPTIFFLKLNFT